MRLYILKTDTPEKPAGADAINKGGLDDNTDEVQVKACRLLIKQNLALLSKKMKAAGTTTKKFEVELMKVFKNLAVQSQRSQFSTLAL